MSEIRRFACTQCGKCCNRSPEVELSEAAPLADVFVFRLMFRMYSLPRAPERGADAALFWEKKRLLAAHAARKYPKKAMRGGKAVEVTNYLMISALALDTTPGACAALSDNRCSIHERRPLGCRTVPFHYSRPERLAALDFDAFVSTAGYRCDTSAGAPAFLQDGRIADPETLQTRADALGLAERDRPWKEAIVRRMKTGGNDALPSLEDVQANASFAAMTTSMRIAWEIGLDAALLPRGEYCTLVDQQLTVIDRDLASGDTSVACWRTLQEMRTEYRHILQRVVPSY